MSDVTEWIEERRGIHTAATAGPWESGYWYHVQGESHCMCGEDQGPLVGIDPHGSFGRMHVHRRPEPIWEEGIRTRDDSTGGSDVVVDTDEYGGTSAEDRAAIVDAHNMFPRALTALEQVLKVHSPGDVFTWAEDCADQENHHLFTDVRTGDMLCEDEPIGRFCNGCMPENDTTIDVDEYPWPCPTVQTIEGAIK